MPNLGILTYHNAINYGAVLQAYGLKTYLSADYDVHIINYISDAVEQQYSFLSLNKSGSVKNFVSHNLTSFIRRKKIERFHRFQLEYLDRDKKQIKSQNLAKECSKNDCVIVGSDQVWSAYGNNNDISYFLPFQKTFRKIGYAVSSGSIKNIELYKNNGFDIDKYISDFDFLSFREQELNDYISEKVGIVGTTVLDPVFFLQEAEWRKISRDFQFPYKNTKYVFVYNLGDNPALHTIVDKYQKITHSKVVIVNKDIKGDILSLKRKSVSNIGPEEFLSYIGYADFIITDSFHATALAIIYRKQFLTIANSTKDQTNSRLSQLLNSLSLGNRMLFASDEADVSKMIENRIDYTGVVNALNYEMEKSKQFLLEAINSRYY